MNHKKPFVALAVAVGFASVVGASGVSAAGARATGANQPGANEQELGALAVSLDLSPRGTAVWLQQLERNGAATERLLAVTTSGELVMARDGGRTAVVIGVELARCCGAPAAPSSSFTTTRPTLA